VIQSDCGGREGVRIGGRIEVGVRGQRGGGA